MNPKLNKLRTKRKRNSEKIQALTKENESLDKQITELENTEIISLVRSINMTPEQLSIFIKSQTKVGDIHEKT